MKRVASIPRVHLGNALYDPSIAISGSKRLTLDSQDMFVCKTRPLPDLTGRENGLFTVRVPRAYLATSDMHTFGKRSLFGGLEQICRSRAVWGTGIYTDDSDVVAAAVHAGWIRGDFGLASATLDSMHENDATAPETSASKLEQAPERPVCIPRDMDMHITILILPALEAYVSTNMHNIASRSWGSDHDGMSFKINSIEFRDEPRQSRFTGRDAQSRRDRLRCRLQSRLEVSRTSISLKANVAPRSLLQA